MSLKNKLSPIQKGSLFFAPMEGITDEAFRLTIDELFPSWDYYATDFLRVPSVGLYPRKYLYKHFGQQVLQSDRLKNKTIFQILLSEKSMIEQTVQDLNDMEFPWLDINLGCPSKTVCKHGGGSFLLQNHESLKIILKKIRKNFHGRLSTKIRIGFNDSRGFEDLIKLLNDEGVELITVHARTREQLYREPADWKFIRKAVEISQVPIIGNGDVWNQNHIQKMFDETGCFGVMVARGALMSPWVSCLFKKKIKDENNLDLILKFYSNYQYKLVVENVSERGLLKQSKLVSRYIFNNLKHGEGMRRRLLLSQSSFEFYEILNSFKNDLENTLPALLPKDQELLHF